MTIFAKACYDILTMSTINISLPTDHVKAIDAFIDRYGFANRSEFIRSLIRLVRYQPTLLRDAATFPFITPQIRAKNVILKEFAQTKKYSNALLKDMKIGLDESSYFAK